jgi:hypothetical protein
MRLTIHQSFIDLEFLNWGRTVSNTPAITCVPNTARDVCDIVKYAKKHRMGVRVSGFRKQPAINVWFLENLLTQPSQVIRGPLSLDAPTIRRTGIMATS